MEIPPSRPDYEAIEQEIRRSAAEGNADMALGRFAVGYRGIAGPGWTDGDFRRGLELVDFLLKTVEHPGRGGRLRLQYERALYELALGHLTAAKESLQAILAALQVDGSDRDDSCAPCRIVPSYLAPMYLTPCRQAFATATALSGKLREAELLIESTLEGFRDSVRLGGAVSASDIGSNPFGRLAMIHYLQGAVDAAAADFRRADEAETLTHEYGCLLLPYGGVHVTWQVEMLARQGKVRSAQRLLDRCDVEGEWECRKALAAYYELAAATLHLAHGDLSLAEEKTEKVSDWSERTGYKELEVRSDLLRARILMRQNQLDSAEDILSRKLSADASGYQIFGIDAQILLGHLAVLQGTPSVAATMADFASERSRHADCGYLWGEAAAEHLRADAMIRSGRGGERVEWSLRRAYSLRKAMGDARLPNTLALMEAIGISPNDKKGAD